jgi:phage/plasmid-like protein (TIGR03299 family)
MSHEIETFADGTAAFVSAREDAWHRLGTVTRDCLTAEQAMTTARLGGWNVRTVALTATDLSEDGVTTIPITDHFATVRTHPVTGKPDVLGVVGSGYTVVQNEEHCELLNLLVDEAGAHFETAGSLRGGRETFVTMKLPHTLTLDTGHGAEHSDDIDLYLAAMSSHDGTAAWRVIVTPVRIVCANTQRMALNAAKSSYAIRHTRTARSRIAQALQALGLVWRYCEAFENAAQQMINQTLTLDEFQTVVDTLWKVPDDAAEQITPRAAGIRDRRNTTLRGLFTDADTQHAVRGTRWGGLQAITEYLDHYAPAKDDTVRAARVLTSHSLGERKQLAYQLLATL